MNVNDFKQKIMDNLISDEDLENLLNKDKQSQSGNKGGFMSNLIKGYIDGYSKPQLWKLILESSLILVIIIGVIFLNYTDKIDSGISSVILAAVLGFIFGKMK